MDRRQYLRHFAELLTGTAVAQLVNLASYPMLARIYSPSDFGVFATFVAAAAIPSAAACARFDLAIPTASRPGRFAIFWLCIAISSVMGILSAVGAAVYWALVEGSLSIRPILFGMCITLTGFATASSLYLMRHDFYRISAKSVVVRTAVTVAVQLGAGLVWQTSLALIVGFTAGIAAQAAMLFGAIRSDAPAGVPRPSQMRVLFRRYKRQVALDIPNTVIGGLAINLPTFFLASLYGQRIVGFYGLAQRIAVLPMQLFNDGLSRVFFQKAARAHEQHGTFWQELKFTVLVSILIAAGVIVGILAFARPVVGAYLGSRWQPVATILIILSPMLAARSVTSVIQSAAYILRRTRWLLIHNAANVAALTVAFLAAMFARLGSTGFFELATILVSAEYVIFALVLVAAARRGAGSRAVDA